MYFSIIFVERYKAFKIKGPIYTRQHVMKMSKPQEAGTKKKGFQFFGFFSVLLSITIVVSAAVWIIYGYMPQYYLPLSLLMLAVAGVVAYVILTKAVKF